MDDNRSQWNLDRPAVILCLVFVLAFVTGHDTFRISQEDLRAADGNDAAFGQMIRLDGAATRSFYQDLKRTLQDLQREAEQKGQNAYLVIEVHPGPSTYGDVVNVTDLLASAKFRQDFPSIRTVAWIPENTTVTGYNVVVALACRYIVMHPDAALGDISEGDAVTGRLRSTVADVVKFSNNPKVNEALAEGLLDPQIAVLRILPKNQNPLIMTRAEYEQWRKENKNVEVIDRQTIKEAGDRGIVSGRKAHADDVIVVTTANTLTDLENHFDISMRRSGAVLGDKNVALIKVEGMITPVTESFLDRQIDRCEQMGKNVIIFEITSPGGYLSSSINLSNRIANLDPQTIRTVAYIRSQALSGAAILAVSCDDIYMAEDATIGDAAPIEVGRGQQFERAPEKILSVLRVHLRSLGKKKHRPQALLEAMADKDLVVYRVTHDNRSPTYMSQAEFNKRDGEGWEKGAPVPETREDNLFTVTGRRAQELNLATGVLNGGNRVQQLRNLKSELGLDPDESLLALQPTWVDTLVFWLNRNYVTIFLLVVAIICIYLELHLMTGFLGIFSVLCFALFFWSRFLGGTAGWLEVILFMLGLACIMMEIFVIPGFGVFGITGGLLIISSLVMASQTFQAIEPSRNYQQLAQTLGQLALSIVLVIALAVVLSRYLPHVPLFGRLVLTPPGHSETAVTEPQLAPSALDEKAALVGQEGQTVSVLRPAGKANINGRMYDVVSDGPYISAGAAIEVVSVSGNRIVVREV